MDSNQQTQLNEKSDRPTGDRKLGLYGKYKVERIDGRPLKGDYCIVLEIGDPNTWSAIAAFAMDVKRDGYDRLSDDLLTMLNWVTNESRRKGKVDRGS